MSGLSNMKFVVALQLQTSILSFPFFFVFLLGGGVKLQTSVVLWNCLIMLCRIPLYEQNAHKYI